ncbi:CYFA0S19e01574g1_1 [Cyberlindnera fabianii]|uniref:CYFA0S19e01574g1_1 n=1 Tax=Cyberlindnera fabianii TaxID=36022 RepID=A0A061BCS1_CYBFA|nr:CYFA0S19e01574g1_1 [Cyberlindnera fabianii]
MLLLAYLTAVPMMLFLPIVVSAEDIELPTTTVIDILSENVEFSYFLRLLQRNQLVPYLNQQENITLVAPVNSAFAATLCPTNGSHGSSKELGAGACLDQIFHNFSLKQLNNYIVTEPINTTHLSGLHLFTTIANPDVKNLQDPDIESLIAKHAIGSPIMFQRNRSEGTTTINGVAVVDSNLYAASQNAFVQGIEGVLADLESLEDASSSLGDSKVFNNLKGDYLHDLYGKTILLPVDHSFSEYDDYEIEYFYTKYATQDTKRIMNALILDGIYGGDFGEVITEDQSGNDVVLSSLDQGNSILVNNKSISISANVLAQGAIIHLFNDTALIPEIEFNVLKALVGLKADSFVDELLFQDLSELITNNSISQTIFHPQDSSQFSIMSKSSNLYHFVNERIDHLDDTRTLYDTLLCNSKKMGDACQRIKIEPFGSDSIILNNNVMIESGPYNVGNTSIYLTDEDLRTPGDLLSSVNSAVFHCSKSLQFLSKLGLTKLSSNQKGYTVFLPCYDAWDDYEMTLDFLKYKESELGVVMRNLILEGLIYTDFVEEKVSFTNLNKEDVVVKFESLEDADLNLELNGENVTLGNDNDILFNQGVIHPIESVFFPKSVNVSLFEIFEHSDSGAFMRILDFFPDLKRVLTDGTYSLILPSASSLDLMNPLPNNSTLKELLQLHIIPDQSLKDLSECTDGEISTLHPKVNLTCSSLHAGGSFLQIKNGKESGVRVLRKGCTTGNKLSCVYLIDKPINPDWIDGHDHYHVSLPIPALVLGIAIGSMSIVAVLVFLMLVIARKRKDLVLEAAENNEAAAATADETTALLRGENSNGNGTGSSPLRNGYDATTFESQYSSHTNVSPITFGKKKPSANIS